MRTFIPQHKFEQWLNEAPLFHLPVSPFGTALNWARGDFEGSFTYTIFTGGWRCGSRIELDYCASRRGELHPEPIATILLETAVIGGLSANPRPLEAIVENSTVASAELMALADIVEKIGAALAEMVTQERSYEEVEHGVDDT